MIITKIEINNIKGIEQKTFNLDLAPNKPNILVAPNGFGKSSFAIAFESLKSNKIELDDKNYYKNSTANRPSLTLTTSNGLNLVANDTQNTISDHFDVFVINNQTEPKSKVQRYGRRTIGRASLDIRPTILIPTIPQKIGFNYSPRIIKAKFGVNGNKVLKNISNLFTCGSLFYEIENKIDFTRFSLKNYIDTIEHSLTLINERTESGGQIRNWIRVNVLPSLVALDEYQKFSKIIKSFEFIEVANDVDSFLAVWQILVVKGEMGTNFGKACKYLYYIADKEHYTKTIESFNPVKDRFDIKPTETANKKSLVVYWPKAHEISNGQRDILTFLALLLKSKRSFKKKDCILIIDEIFDYLDDANLITFQYYISTFINEMKRRKNKIFPILLTHLDPLFFNHFCFNDSKIKVCYIKDINIKTNQQILKLIYNRANTSIQNDVDAYFFHFHHNISTVDLTAKFETLGLNKDWGKPDAFLKKINREVRRYLCEETAFDPLAICFGVRIKIEELVYNTIPDAKNKCIFIEKTNGTKNKLNFAQSIGIDIPESYFLLGIIYNTSLHLSDGQDISKPLGLKLENNTIKQMIKNIFSF